MVFLVFTLDSANDSVERGVDMDIHILHADTEKFIYSLEKPTTNKIIRMIELLKLFGHRLRMPYARQIDNRLFELRTQGMQEVRLLYTFKNETVYILHGFLKKTNKTPMSDLAKALQRKKSLEDL